MSLPALGGRYTIVRELGAGGMGTVYEAVQLDLERTVAIKVLPPAAAGDLKANARLRQEAMAAARLGHPNVVEVFELGTADDGSPFIVMERLVGTSLRGVLASGGRMSPERAVHVAVQMLDALGAAHAAGIVHRDVKPANVMVLDDDRVKLVDFGIARFSEDERSVRTTTGTLLGTPAYLAPEQLDGRGVDGRTDLHAVGLCLFEMLLGARPWRGPISEVATAVMRTIPPRVDSRRDDVPRALADVVERALAKDPNARFASAKEMSAALRASLPPARRAAVAAEAPRAAAGSRRVFAIAVAIGVAAASAIAIAFVRPSPRQTLPPAPPTQASPPPIASVADLADDAPEPSSGAATATAATTATTATKTNAPVPAGPIEDVLCNDPRYRYGNLCAKPHPSCYCNRQDEVRGAEACGQPFVAGRCPGGAPPFKAPPTSKPGGPCTLYFSQDGKEWLGTGTASCDYCGMAEWRNEPSRRGVVGAPCTGIDYKGQTVTGRWLRAKP